MTELLHILADPAHWVAEVVMDGVIWLLVGVAATRRHDRKVHGKRTNT